MYPIWLKMFMPPHIFLTLTIYLIILLILLFIFKEKNIKNILFKSIVSITMTNIFPSIVLIILSLFNNLKDIILYNNNYIYFIIALFVMILSGVSNYLIHKKYIIKNNNLLCLIISIIFIPYLILIPLKQNQKLTDYKNTYIGDNSKVSAIINLLNIDKTSISLQTTNEPYVLNINLSSETSSISLYQTLEEKASIMFNLITNVSIINYSYKEKTYTFSFDQVNQMYNNNLRNIEIEKINKRYDNFNQDYIYMGYINGYDIFDESITCESNEELVKKENNISYYITCSSLNEIYLYKDKQKYKLKDKLNEFKIEDLLKTNLNIYQK